MSNSSSMTEGLTCTDVAWSQAHCTSARLMRTPLGRKVVPSHLPSARPGPPLVLLPSLCRPPLLPLLALLPKLPMPSPPPPACPCSCDARPSVRGGGPARCMSITVAPTSLTWDTRTRSRKRSYRASSSPLSGSSFDAPTSVSSGTCRSVG
eukprot:127511-Chlamydomonas_euryale.AAC.1